MKYFIDFEFIEGLNKPFLWPFFGKRRHFIDLISVGIVCEDGREYYAISKNFNAKDADNWVRENVISKLPTQHLSSHGSSPRQMQDALLWKHNNMITYEILQFFGCTMKENYTDKASDWIAPNGIEVYGYYADYDWVLLCSLFGRMIDLPTNFPMYCKDLKQMLDMEAELAVKNHCTNEWEAHQIIKGEIRNKLIPAFKTIEEALNKIKANPRYPKQTDEHNALADAKWNKQLYDFLQLK